MKSARERAEILAENIGFVRGGLAWRAFTVECVESFKEHARDQRHLIAEVISALPVPMSAALQNSAGWEAGSQATFDAAHAAAVNAPAPGEGRDAP